MRFSFRLLCLAAIVAVLPAAHSQPSGPKPQSNSIQVTLPTEAYVGSVFADAKAPVFYYSDGTLASLVPKADAAVDGLTYAAGERLYFYANGRVAQGMLKTSASVSDLTFAERTQLQLYPSGQPNLGTLAANASAKLLNLSIPAGAQVTFDSVDKAVFAQSVLNIYLFGGTSNILGYPLTSAGVRFNRNQGRYVLQTGKLAQPVLACLVATAYTNNEPTALAPVVAPIGTTVTFPVNDFGEPNPASPLMWWQTAGPMKVNGQDFGRNPWLFADGMLLQYIVTQEDTTINGKPVKARTQVLVNRDGTFTPAI